MDEVFADPQVRHLGLTRTVEHPELGLLSIVRNAVTMTGGAGTGDLETARSPSPASATTPRRSSATSTPPLTRSTGSRKVPDLTSPSLDAGTDQLLVSLDGAVATLTFNNLAKRNALSSAIRAALPGTLKVLNADDSGRVIVVTGAGGKAFVSGADISEFGDQRTSVEARATYDAEQAAIRDAWEAVGKRIIAMI